MYSPLPTPPVNKPQDEGSCFTTRNWLLVWGILRLIVSILWTGTILWGKIEYLHNAPGDLTCNDGQDRARLWFYESAVLIQFVEFGMLLTFITAGVKKSARLYRVYYRYCILTLIIYIIAVTLSSILDYYDTRSGHYFTEVYLTYHIDALPINISGLFNAIFVLIAIFDMGLEILLLGFVKQLMYKYSFIPSENVESVVV